MQVVCVLCGWNFVDMWVCNILCESMVYYMRLNFSMYSVDWGRASISLCNIFGKFAVNNGFQYNFFFCRTSAEWLLVDFVCVCVCANVGIFEGIWFVWGLLWTTVTRYIQYLFVCSFSMAGCSCTNNKWISISGIWWSIYFWLTVCGRCGHHVWQLILHEHNTDQQDSIKPLIIYCI